MTDNDLEKWQTNSSKYLVNDRWLKLRADSCTTPDGHAIEPFYVLEYPDWANCFVIEDNNDVIMVKHYRHGVDEYIPELVSGGLEKSDTSPEEGMKRELEEEIGYVAGQVHETGVSYPNPASQTNKVHSFIAFGGSCKQEQKLEKGENLHIMKVPLKDLVKMLEDKNSGVIYQSMHLTSIFFALNFIKGSQLPEMQEMKKSIYKLVDHSCTP
jgi:8-oxo-dGTP pyrophosphatase MutT (NUDIX family)